MKTRIIVAAIFVPLLFVVLFYLHPVVITVVVACIAAIASYELLRAVGAAATKRLCVYAAVSAALLPITVFIGPGNMLFRAILILFMAVLFGDAILSYQKTHEIKFSQITAVVFAGSVIPYFLSAIVSLKIYSNGQYYVLLPFLIAFMTDGGAYFTGVFFGRHKAFRVSPKKTIEGCVGGIMTGVAAAVLFGVLLHFTTGLQISFWALSLYGLVGGIVTELGDLAFSLIKREFSVKDYGNLLPGHGGILDRFDSMIFAAPVLYLLVTLLPALT